MSRNFSFGWRSFFPSRELLAETEREICELVSETERSEMERLRQSFTELGFEGTIDRELQSIRAGTLQPEPTEFQSYTTVTYTNSAGETTYVRELPEAAPFFQELLDRDAPPLWIELRRLAELGTCPTHISYLMNRHGMSVPFEPTAPLRDPDDTDTLGAETDAMLGMGEAETWFREKMG